MHALEFVRRQLTAHAFQVNHLSAAHSGRARRTREFCDDSDFLFVSNAEVGENGKCKRLQSVACKQRLRFTERHVTRGLAAPQRIVVHAGQVVMHQGIRVDRLNRKCNVGQDFLRRFGDVTRGIDKKRPNAFSPAQERVFHCVIEFDERRFFHPKLHGLKDELGPAFEMPPMRSGPAFEIRRLFTHFPLLPIQTPKDDRRFPTSESAAARRPIWHDRI